MTTSVLLLHYNNYFNRIIKKEDSLQEYLQADANSVSCLNINFVPGDGISTSLILGKGNTPADIFTGEKNGFDYLIVYDSDDANYPILSRWFIIETHRTREGQYDLRLRRDIVVDFYETIVDSPIYLEKGYISDTQNPLLFNSESLQVNQIKQSEIALKDKTKCGWVVGYIPRDAYNTSEGTDVVSSAIFAQSADITVTNLNSWEYWGYCDLNSSYKTIGKVNQRKEISWKLKSLYQNNASYFYSTRNISSYVGSDEQWKQTTTQSGSGSVSASLPSWYTSFSGVEWKDTYAESGSTTGNKAFGSDYCTSACANLLTGGNINGYLNSFIESKTNVIFNNTTWNAIDLLDGKIIFDQANNLYYRIRVLTAEVSSETYTVTDSDTDGVNIRTYISNNLVRTGFQTHGTLLGNLASEQVYKVKVSEGTKYISLEQVTIEVKANINNTRTHLEDAPYDMFCIPYSDEIQMTDGQDTWTCNKAVALSIATDIGAKSGSGNIYDIQLLPYCPNVTLINNSLSPDTLLDISLCNYDIVQTTESTPRKVTAIIWCPKSTFTFEIPAEYGNYVDLSTPDSVKATNDCTMFRLSAGNYSAIFEFSPAKSFGYDGYVVDCTYKPFTPWIHIIPKLKGLYGENFTIIDDARGLICGGDYSITQLSNLWANYQLTNKTYQDVFDRSIKNMDVNNEIARQEQLFQSFSGAITGGLTGAASGALAGAKGGAAGSALGAAAGGLAGVITGVAGGIMDYNNLVTRQEEAKSYAVDLFNYSLQNIQAVPTALSKTSALVANTRIWPFLEIYTCTDIEKQAYLDKIKYDGMTIMAIGKLSDYIVDDESHYFKGEIIRLPNLKEDAHMANEICLEIKKGVYL